MTFVFFFLSANECANGDTCVCHAEVSVCTLSYTPWTASWVLAMATTDPPAGDA